jgi:hypothetical protein
LGAQGGWLACKSGAGARLPECYGPAAFHDREFTMSASAAPSTTASPAKAAALAKARARRAELAAKINGDNKSVSTEEWDEFFALAQELHKLGHLKPEAVDDGPTP